ncbi:hypothetical protein BGZ98_007261 [Dissophora globulifera]|nr:hypothetical protein BGZ98_007261 [Dissophora globulifera]
MRRAHPQRAKAPPASLDTDPGASGYRNKTWATITDLRHQIQSRQSKADSHRQNDSGHSNSGNSNDIRGKADPSRLVKTCTISCESKNKEQATRGSRHEGLSSGEDTDNDFQEESSIKKSRRIGIQSTPRTSRRGRPSSTGSGNSDQAKQDSGLLPSINLQNHTRMPPDIEGHLEDLSPSSPDAFDLDFTMNTISSDSGSPRLGIPNDAPPTSPSAISDMQNALNEIDELLMEVSAPSNLDPHFHSAASRNARAGMESPVFHETFALRCDSTTDSPTLNVQKVRSTNRVQSTRIVGWDESKIEAEAFDESIGGSYHVRDHPDESQVYEQRQKQEHESVQHTPAFEIPESTAEFTSRLEDIRTRFKASLDSMLEAIQEVNSFHSSVKDALSKHQEYLDNRGKQISLRVHGLQKEASVLHLKATKDSG